MREEFQKTVQGEGSELCRIFWPRARVLNDGLLQDFKEECCVAQAPWTKLGGSFEPEPPSCSADAVATMRILALVPLAAAFAPPPAAPRRARQILRAEPLTQEQRNVVETFREGMERHPTMVKSVAARTKELLEDERDNLDDDSLPAKFDRFFNGLVRHPAMLWGTFLRVAELMEEELIEAGDAESAAKADTIRQVRIAAEAVKGSREL